MDGERKYYGMTVKQLSILGGLAGALLLVVVVGGWLAIRKVRSTPSSWTPTAPPPPTVTSIYQVPPTLTPTITPTPIPYEQLVPTGWMQFKTPLIEIWMPNNFKLATKKTKDITANIGTPNLLLAEVTSKSSAYTMLVSVSYDVIPSGTLDEFLNAKFPSLPYQARISDRRTVFVNTREARRIVVEFKYNNIDYNNLVYVLQDGGTVWYIEYVAEISEFFENIPVFEQSIQTFRPVGY